MSIEMSGLNNYSMADKVSNISQKQLQEENKELRNRLAEAEETLNAIRSGEGAAHLYSGA